MNKVKKKIPKMDKDHRSLSFPVDIGRPGNNEKKEQTNISINIGMKRKRKRIELFKVLLNIISF